jgi:transcriptional regulator with XRE-family HTH domain
MSYPTTDYNFSPTQRLSNALRRVKASTKEIARRAGYAPPSVKNWRSGANTMSADALIALCREYDEIWVEVCAMARRSPDTMTGQQFADEIARRLNGRQS